MYRIGIDVGSTYTKYCVMRNEIIVDVFSESTPIRQKEFFKDKIEKLYEKYPNAIINSCGYGKSNIAGLKKFNELTALASGCNYILGRDSTILDIGGQDTKVITQKEGHLRDFFLNDKCAAGSGMFLTNVLRMLDLSFNDLNLEGVNGTNIILNSTCAVFAQSEIVELIADNTSEKDIINSVIWQIFTKAKSLLNKVETEEVILSGGLSKIKGIRKFAEKALGISCITIDKGEYLSAIGCCFL